MAVYSASTGGTASLLFHRLPGFPNQAAFLSPIPNSRSLNSAPWKRLKAETRRKLYHVVVKASSPSDETPLDANELLSDLKEKWDAVENKPSLVLYTTGAVVALWLSSSLIDVINRVPVLPKFMELVGVGYTGWFIYRYLLFKSSRKELAADIESLKKKITGPD